MVNEQYIKIFLKAHSYCIKNNFAGYSLYDSHNSFIPFQKFGKYVSFYMNQFIKRYPINLRPLLGIKKEYNPKGIGIFLNLYSQLKGLGVIDENELIQLTDSFLNLLLDKRSKGYNGYCWGYNYNWPNRDGSIVPAFMPSGVVTGFICRALMQYYISFNNTIVKEIISGAADFVLNDLKIDETKYGLCISYTPNPYNYTVNASLLAAEILAYDDYLNNTLKHKDIINGVLQFTCNTQNNDGSWYYSFEPLTYKPKKQIDFHQGYVLETMSNILKYSTLYEEKYENIIKKGFQFYINRQIDPDGKAYWRFPKKWPVDIHNQSQAIITLNRFSHLDLRCSSLLNSLIVWTVKNMMSKNGIFYYQRWPLFTNKVSYMRWNQAWMMLALVEVMKKNNNE